MTKLAHLTALLFLLINCQTSAQTTDLLRQRIQQIISTKKADVGVSIIGNSGKDTLSINGDGHFPMQSVFKLHIGLAMLSKIDNGVIAVGAVFHRAAGRRRRVYPTRLPPENSFFRL
jgi:beta-lactamase class A/beta-lactamase class A VEB